LPLAPAATSITLFGMKKTLTRLLIGLALKKPVTVSLFVQFAEKEFALMMVGWYFGIAVF
jgi:hypothetical protein